MLGTLTFDTISTTNPKFILQWAQNKVVNINVDYYPSDIRYIYFNTTTPSFDFYNANILSKKIYYSNDNGSTWFHDTSLACGHNFNNNQMNISIYNSVGASSFRNSMMYKLEIIFNNTSSNTIFNESQQYSTSVTSNLQINDSNLTLSAFQTLQIFCLFEDTGVLTTSGYVSVKSLQVGDFVTTSYGRASHIKRIWSSHMPVQQEFLPIIIPENSIAENYPPKDCRLSKYHLINFNGNWITPYKNEHIFKYDREVKSIKYYHLELENYMTDHLVINGGLVVESLGNGEKDNSTEWSNRVDNSIIL